MRRTMLERIKARVRLRQYDMTAHAMEEMAEDDLDILDVEHALLAGRIVRIEKKDPRGRKCVIEGSAVDGSRVIGVAGRFGSRSRFLVITVYEITEE